ncbi:thioredoxin fold domain-containing protein [Shewanella oncorhynchi]|uniref:thioredoxin fold domain-containing protein n=1 Tax=Shewanella oncorhynchi TaxID=2726434 RepID=UPI003D7920C0
MKYFIPNIAALMFAGSMTLGMGFAAHAAELAPPQLDNLIQKGVVNVVETFKHDTLTGWLVENNGDHHLYWATQDDYVIAGPLIDKNGINLTSKYLEEKKPVPNYNDVFAQFEKQATYISTHPERAGGESKEVLYVFAEPFCGWCSKLHKELQPAIAAGLEVRWVPVAFLRGNSSDVIEHFLSADNPLSAMNEHELLREQGKPVNTKPVTQATRAKIELNGEFMKRFDIHGTPGLVYEIGGKARTGSYMKVPQMTQLIKSLKSK